MTETIIDTTKIYKTMTDTTFMAAITMADKAETTNQTVTCRDALV